MLKSEEKNHDVKNEMPITSEEAHHAARVKVSWIVDELEKMYRERLGISDGGDKKVEDYDPKNTISFSNLKGYLQEVHQVDKGIVNKLDFEKFRNGLTKMSLPEWWEMVWKEVKDAHVIDEIRSRVKETLVLYKFVEATNSTIEKMMAEIDMDLIKKYASGDIKDIVNYVVRKHESKIESKNILEGFGKSEEYFVRGSKEKMEKLKEAIEYRKEMDKIVLALKLLEAAARGYDAEQIKEIYKKYKNIKTDKKRIKVYPKELKRLYRYMNKYERLVQWLEGKEDVEEARKISFEEYETYKNILFKEKDFQKITKEEKAFKMCLDEEIDLLENGEKRKKVCKI